METLNSEIKLCLCCMEEHEVQTIRVLEHNEFKGQSVEYYATYEYCNFTDEYVATEEMASANDTSFKDAYREKVGLLTSAQICNIRKKYGMSQTDLSTLLGWGLKTITRYESHQIQDTAHDTILRKLNEDPEWFCSLLSDAQNKFSKSVYQKYLTKAQDIYSQHADAYLRKMITAKYAPINGDRDYCGNTKLNLNKVIEVISYFAKSRDVTALFKVKLMKLLWYADSLSYKRYSKSITGLAYQALQMGAVPVCHESIINLSGVLYEEVNFEDDKVGYHFLPNEEFYPQLLNKDEISVINAVILRFGKKSKDEIVNTMHQERAYKETAPFDIIQYQYSKELSIK